MACIPRGDKLITLRGFRKKTIGKHLSYLIQVNYKIALMVSYMLLINFFLCGLVASPLKCALFLFILLIWYLLNP
jgi:hypothetical protein